MWHLFLTPSFVLSGVNNKSRSLQKLSTPLLLSKHVLTVIFSPKPQALRISKSQFFSYVDPPIVAMASKVTLIHHVITITVHPAHDLWPEMFALFGSMVYILR